MGGIDHGVAMWENSRGFQPTGMVPVFPYVSRRDTGSLRGIGTIACGTRRSGVATRHEMLLVRSVPWVETHGYYPSPLRGGE